MAHHLEAQRPSPTRFPNRLGQSTYPSTSTLNTQTEHGLTAQELNHFDVFNLSPVRPLPPLDPQADPLIPSSNTVSLEAAPRSSGTRRPSKAILTRDFILGFADGLTVPFALTAGLSSLNSSHLVILAGLAELASGAISMGLGAYLAAVTEAKRYNIEERKLYAFAAAAADTADTPADDEDEELRPRCWSRAKHEDEILRVLGDFGIQRKDAASVATALKGRKDLWVKFMLTVDLQLAQPASEGAWIEGLVMGLAYLLGGLLPMIPYFCTHRTTHALFASAGMTAIILLVFGYVKSHMTGCSSREHLLSAMHTLLVGIVAAGTSYGIVRLVNAMQ